MKIKNTFGLEEVEEIFFDQNAVRSENAESGGMFAFELGDLCEIVGGAGMKKEFDVWGEGF